MAAVRVPQSPRTPIMFVLFFLLLSTFLPSLRSQQPYLDNRQLDCYNPNYNDTTEGFHCNGPSRSCQSYVTFRPQPPYASLSSIASLLNSDASQIRSLNHLSSASAPSNKPLFVPVNCSCAGPYYQHNATYRLQFRNQTYFIVANNTFQGLSTCQALMSQNRYGDRSLTPGLELVVPIRCACPTVNQTSAGYKYLVSYLVTWGETITALAEAFGINETDLRQANELSSDIIYPFTPLLIPIKTDPSRIRLEVPPPPPQPAPQPPSGSVKPPSSSSHKHLFVFLGVGIAAGLIVIILLSLALFCIYRGKDRKKKPSGSPEPEKMTDSGSKFSAIASQGSAFWTSIQGVGVRHAIESLTLYKFEDLQAATADFDESNRIKGSAYKGWFKGDNAVVKVMKGDVSAEINLLKMINHSSIVRLSGFCVHHGNSYLVYEWVENGSLSDWIHSDKESATTSVLTWNQRVQIASDVADALNYLHNYATPPCIHKNLKSSNVLLDSNFRAKVANFGLARSLSGDSDEGDVQLTRHVVGTHGYMPPEYVENGVITPKLDVFAFGVVLLELLSGKEAAKHVKDSGEEVLHEEIARVLEGENVREKLMDFMDPSLGQAYPLELAFAMAQLAQTCVARDLNARPPVAQALATLSMILSSTLDWDSPYTNDHSSSFGNAK